MVIRSSLHTNNVIWVDLCGASVNYAVILLDVIGLPFYWEQHDLLSIEAKKPEYGAVVFDYFALMSMTFDECYQYLLSCVQEHAEACYQSLNNFYDEPRLFSYSTRLHDHEEKRTGTVHRKERGHQFTLLMAHVEYTCSIF